MLDANTATNAANQWTAPSEYTDAERADFRAGVRDALMERRKPVIVSAAYKAGYRAAWRLR
jgi:hypothetical protein